MCNKNREEWYLKNGKCANGHIKASILDDSIWEAILTITRRDEDIFLYTRNQSAPDDSTEQLERLTHYNNELQEKRASIIQWYREDLINKETADKELQIVQKEITATASAIAVITKKHSKEQPKIFNITAENILNAHTFQHKRDLLLNNGYCGL